MAERLQVLGIEHESGVDIESSEIRLYVNDVDKVRSLAAAELKAIPYVTVHHVPGFLETTATIYGGRSVIGSTQQCTTGFNVVNSIGIRGVSTAGHCDNALNYSGTALAFQSELDAGSFDVQWNRHAGSTYPNQIYIGSGYHIITAVLGSSALPLGWTVCKYGASGGYLCGEVADKNAQSSYKGQIGTYIRVRNVNNLPMSVSGDSGGPVFGANTAYGIIHGRGAAGTPNVNDMYFMPVERFSSLNISVAISP